MTVARSAPAKVNLWLRIGERRPSGYHDLDTLFCALDLADSVSVAAGPSGTGVRLHLDFAAPLDRLPDLGPAPGNLAVRAAGTFAERAGTAPDLEVFLVKRIPPGGGLGGGSSDAAAVLRALARIHPDAITPAGLLEIAAALGSDVPFFLEANPLARGLGRGTEVAPVASLPARPVLVVLPPFGIPTADAYRWLTEDRDAGRLPAPTALGAGGPPGSWGDVEAAAANDFEPAVFRRHPELGRIRDTLARSGARPALLSGSGATVFGVYDDEHAASAALDQLQRSFPALRTVLTRTRSR